MFGLFIDYSEKEFCYAQRNLAFAGYRTEKCQNCGRNIVQALPTKQKDEFVLDGGKQYPDFLYYGGAGIYFLISDRVLNVFNEQGITGYDQATEVSVFREHKSVFVKQDVSYYLLNITGSIDFNLKAMGLKRKNRCSCCDQFDWSRQRLSIIKTVFDMNTWDKSDLCRINSFPGHVVCSEKSKTLLMNTNLSELYFRMKKVFFAFRNI